MLKLIFCHHGLGKPLHPTRTVSSTDLVEIWQERHHRIMEWFGLEEALKYHLVRPFCHGQKLLSLDQVTQSPIQLGLEHFRERDIHNFSGKPVSLPHHPHSEEFLPYIQFTSTLFQFQIIAPCPVTTDIVKTSLSIFIRSLFYILKGRNKVSLELFLIG